MVNPVSKSEVPHYFPPDVEGVRIVKSTTVSVRRTVKDVYVGICGNVNAGNFRIRHRDTFCYLQRRFKAEHFLHGRRDLV